MTVVAENRTSSDAPPTGREEAWRFTPLSRLRGLHLSVDGADQASINIVASPEARVESVATHTLDAPSGPVEYQCRLVLEAAPLSSLLILPRNSVGSVPSVITITGTGTDLPTVGNLVIRAEQGSTGVVVIEHVGSTSYVGNVEIEVGDGADLTVISIQSWADDTVHLGRQHAQLGRDSRFRSLVATLGGDVVRVVPTVSYSAPGGDAELLGVFFAERGQHVEHRLQVDHSEPHCRSNVVYKGALQDDGTHSVWIGDVLIRAEAVGTQTYEINRNLLLTTGARADSVPNLEIETGNVTGAGHASATGRFDDEQLFYLRSRGIDADSARRLVVHGFFAEIVGRIPTEGVGARIMAAIERKLAGGDDARTPDRDGGEQ